MKHFLLSLFIAIIITSCRSTDRLDYDKNTPLLTHSLRNSNFFIDLPYPVLVSPPRLQQYMCYSNDIRIKRCGTLYSGKFDYSTSNVSVFNGTLLEQNESEGVKLRYFKSEKHFSTLFRKLLIIVDGKPISLVLYTSVCDSGDTKEANDKIATEDSDLFLRLVGTIIIKGESAKWFRIAVNPEEFYNNIKLVTSNNAEFKELTIPLKLVELENLPDIISEGGSTLTVKIMSDKEKPGGYLYSIGDNLVTRQLGEIPALCRKVLSIPESIRMNVNIDSAVVYNKEFDFSSRDVLLKGNIEIKHVLASYINYFPKRDEESQEQKSAPHSVPGDEKQRM